MIVPLSGGPAIPGETMTEQPIVTGGPGTCDLHSLSTSLEVSFLASLGMTCIHDHAGNSGSGKFNLPDYLHRRSLDRRACCSL
jgi:hypothetical protein